MPLVNQTLSLSKAAVYTASLLNFPLAHPAFPQSRLLLEKTSPMKVDMTSRGKELGSLGLPAENKCQPSSLFHLVLKSLFFHTMLQRHMNRAAPGAAPQFPKGVYWSLNSRKPTVVGKSQTGTTNEKLKNLQSSVCLGVNVWFSHI